MAEYQSTYGPLQWKVSWEEPAPATIAGYHSRTKLVDLESKARRFAELVSENGNRHPRAAVLRDNGLGDLAKDIPALWLLAIDDAVNDAFSDGTNDAEKLEAVKLILKNII